MLRKVVKTIPNTITLLNLLSGLVAVYFAFNCHTTFGSLLGWQMCAIMIGAAAVFDFCDGFAARLLHAKSAIGKELDSLCDLVSFGVAPAMLMMNYMLWVDAGWWSYVALFIPLMGALRLAKFNIDDSQATEFKGLPIPANAIFWIGAVAFMESCTTPIKASIVAGVIIVISLLMVSNLRMESLKFSNLSVAKNIKRYLLIVGAVLFVAFFGLTGLAMTILFYILLSFIKISIEFTVEK